MTKRPHVALIVETSIDYGRQILRGVTRYLRSHQTWHVFLEQRELWTAPPPGSATGAATAGRSCSGTSSR